MIKHLIRAAPPPTSLREDYYPYHRTATFKIYLFESNVLFCCSTNEQHKDATCTIVVFKYFKPNILVLISIYLREAQSREYLLCSKYQNLHCNGVHVFIQDVRYILCWDSAHRTDTQELFSQTFQPVPNTTYAVSSCRKGTEDLRKFPYQRLHLYRLRQMILLDDASKEQWM